MSQVNYGDCSKGMFERLLASVVCQRLITCVGKGKSAVRIKVTTPQYSIILQGSFSVHLIYSKESSQLVLYCTSTNTSAYMLNICCLSSHCLSVDCFKTLTLSMIACLKLGVSEGKVETAWLHFHSTRLMI